MFSAHVFWQPGGEEICYQCIRHENCRRRDLTPQDAPSESRGMHPMHYLSSHTAITFHLPELPQQFHLKAFLEPLYFLAWKKCALCDGYRRLSPEGTAGCGQLLATAWLGWAGPAEGVSHTSSEAIAWRWMLTWKILPAEPYASVGAGLVQGVLLAECFGPILP